MTKRITVIMGVYNCAETLPEAIDSLLAQTCDDWELVMCDDGSVDTTREVAQRYVDAHPDRIRLLVNEHNMGLNYTLNKCLDAAQSEYVARMDGDDVSMPTRFEKELAFLDAHPEYALVSCRMGMFDEGGDWGATQVIPFPTRDDFCTHAPFFCHAACMIRTSAFKEVGGYTVDPRLLRVEDVHLWFKLYAAGYKGANIDEVLYKMRDDRNASSRRTLRNRLNFGHAMSNGFRMLHMPWYKYVYVARAYVREFLKFLLPQGVYLKLHKGRYGNPTAESAGPMARA